MKRCPECRRDYYDDTLLYCLDDGNALLEGPRSEPGAIATGFRADEPQTAILHSTAAPGEAPTRAQIHTTEQTAILSTGAEAEPRESLGGLAEKQSFSANRAAKPLLALLAVIVVAGIGFGIYKFVSGKQSSPAPSFESMKITKLTDTGKAGSAAISPDGKYVLHAKEDGGQTSLWVRHIATGSNVQIIPPAEMFYGRTTFSPDGSYIYFGRRANNVSNLELFQIPVLGGEPKKLNSHVNSVVTFSPDGKRIAFVRNLQAERRMIIANADGTGEQLLATTMDPNGFRETGPAWSPDGKVIATGLENNDGTGRYHNIVEISVEDGSIKPIGSLTWSNVSRVAWLADGSGLITTCSELGTLANQVYQIPYPGGEARKITNDFNVYYDLSVTADSGSLVTVQEERVANIWIAPDSKVGSLRQLTKGPNKYEGFAGLRWTPDGKIVYTQQTGSTPNVLIMNGDGSNSRQLTQNLAGNPVVSPDGRYIVFDSAQPGAAGIWRMDIDGGNRKQLADKGGSPDISPDGRSVVYEVSGPEGSRLWKVSIEGGEPVQLTDYPSGPPAISPDGRSIVFYFREQENSTFKFAIIPFEGGQPTKLLDAPAGYNALQLSVSFSGRVIRWLPDSRSLAYIGTRDGVSNIWSLPVDGGAPKQLTNFTTDRIVWFDLSRDGKPTLFSRGSTARDVVLITGFRK